MRKTFLALAALTACAVATPVEFTGVAEARDGCGRGFYFDGFRCVPMRAGPPPVVVVPPPVYVPPPPRYVAPRGFVFAGPDRWGKPQYYPGPRGQCPRDFTLQSGLCKPYRGF
jgi:hypothetical protein